MFDRIALAYDILMYPFEKAILGKWREKIWKEVKGKRVLEVGVGTGANFPFYPKNMLIIGIDKSRNMILKAKDRGNHIIILADAQTLPFKDGTFDSVISTLVFCSVPDPHLGLREINRVLKKGGMLYMLEHVRPEDWKGEIFDIINPLTVFLFGENINRILEMEIQKTGFEILRIEKITSDGLLKYFVARKI